MKAPGFLPALAVCELKGIVTVLKDFEIEGFGLGWDTLTRIVEKASAFAVCGTHSFFYT